MKFLFVFLSLIMSNIVTDSYLTDNGKSLEISFIGHGSIAFNYDGAVIYVDPTEESGDYSELPEADFVFVSHGHGDHFGSKAFSQIKKEGTVVVANAEVADMLKNEKGIAVYSYKNGDTGKFGEGASFSVKAVPAHNHPANYKFHPLEQNNGYLFNFDGLKVYVAGDIEDIPELAELKAESVDIAFLPVNQPYTMTFEQAVHAVDMVSPKIFYPYHFGPTNTQQTIQQLEKMLSGTGVEVKIRPLE